MWCLAAEMKVDWSREHVHALGSRVAARGCERWVCEKVVRVAPGALGAASKAALALVDAAADSSGMLRRCDRSAPRSRD